MRIKQLIFLRNDLKHFSKGGMIAQACHASIFAIWKYKEDEDTKKYLEDINNMTKVILKITENDIDEIKYNLNKHCVEFVEWLEAPENIITSLATRPFVLDDDVELKKYFMKYKLY